MMRHGLKRIWWDGPRSKVQRILNASNDPAMVYSVANGPYLSILPCHTVSKKMEIHFENN